jgi:hypothetical protein
VSLGGEVIGNDAPQNVHDQIWRASSPMTKSSCSTITDIFIGTFNIFLISRYLIRATLKETHRKQSDRPLRRPARDGRAFPRGILRASAIISGARMIGLFIAGVPEAADMEHFEF